ncbi:uncharacterized protein LOC122663036 [Telopea speciosissima]|uniref:uncharacterized protein LOC122663036 n=1 Tax=Telopea speciosissima TaxID=54955 RepID=UPI001CC350E2|nr:uncharacterized protein LOC122663036 [Telopea speciosissima]
MGGCFSCRSFPDSFDVIRVVHFNGSVQDFDDPLTVGDITGKPPKYFVCTPSQLISFNSSEALSPDTQLQRGNIYYVLPLSALQWEASPVDFVGIATRLTKVAKRSGSINHARSPQSSPVLDVLQSLGRSKSTPERVKPISEEVITSVELKESVEHVKMDDNHKISYRAQSWKPILETIKEKSFGRRSESDLPSPFIKTPR